MRQIVKSTFITITMLLSLITDIFAHQKVLITVNQFVNHVALDAAQEGLKKSLTDKGILPNNAEFIVANSQGNIASSVQISRHHASLKPNFMVAIATPPAQANYKAKDQDTIMAFLAVTDARSAGLLGDDNVIGVTDNPPIKELIDIAKQIFPDLLKIGVIYNSGEVNSAIMVDSLAEITKEHKIKLSRAVIANSSDIKVAMQKLIGEVDVIYLPQDNTVISALDNIINLSKAHKVPLIANDPTLVSKGVFLAVGSNYFKSGWQLGDMIADIIENKEIQKIQEAAVREMRINQQIAKMLGIKIPAELESKVAE